MDTLMSWWGSLQPLNQWFYIAAAFFSVFFLWQVIMAVIGLGGGDADFDTHVEPAWEHATPTDAGDTVLTFKLLSVRSVLAFFTLFTWAGALYLNRHLPVGRALVYAVLWGLAALAIVSLVFHLMKKMTESGTMNIRTCIGASGTVYLDIPAGSQGEVRVLCSGVVTHFKARTVDGAALKAGTLVRVVRPLGPNMLAVEPDTGSTKEKEQST